MTATITAPATPEAEQVPKPARPPLPSWRVVAGVASLTLAGLALWAFFYVLVVSNIQHARAQHQLYARFRTELANAVAPVGGVIAPGSPVAVLTVPDAGLHGEVVVEGTTSGLLRDGPGHVRTSPLPGQPGVSFLYGRATSFGAPFGRLGGLRPGAKITVTTDQGTFHYVVRDLRHAGDPWTLPTAGQSMLTLATSQGGWSPSSVLYVDALLDGKPVVDPGGRLTALNPDERLMAGESGPLLLMELVLWLQAALVVAVGLTWLRTRWRATQVWLVGLPTVVAVLWGVSNTAVRLLPNLL